MSILTKPAKSSLIRILTKGIKPATADRIPGTSPKRFVYKARWISSDHKEKSMLCTPELYLKIANGGLKKRKGQFGLDYKHHTGFVLHARPPENGKRIEDGVACLIDSYPNRPYTHKVLPVDAPDRKFVTIEIDILGQYNVTSVPCPLRERVMLRLLEELDKLETIEDGQIIKDTPFVVHQIAGRRVDFDANGDYEEPAEDSDFMGF